ncbi:MAG TPA: DUF1801 domain-containing protein [Propionicimonas sp.]|jgi:hypothetical protein|uniref:iron chaperone n=1 Tax=Propionicimonas sp. TaxID=1955623 RepID=UPI002F428077
MAATENFTAEERAAMKERAAEMRASRKKPGKDLEPEVLAKIAELPPEDRAMAERLHALIREAAPELTPRMWYGQPAYARDGKVVVFFQPATKFQTRYSTLGFSEDARLDDGAMWPTAWALTSLGDAELDAIARLVTRAAG